MGPPIGALYDGVGGGRILVEILRCKYIRWISDQ